MASIYITDSFYKQIRRTVEVEQIISVIRRHILGSQNMVDIYSPGPDLKVFKAYLFSGRFRLAVLLQVRKDVYVPFLFVKKESKYGWNLSKYSEEMLISSIDRVLRDIQKARYQLIDVNF